MHDHFEEGDGGDADVFEVVWVGSPGASIIFGFDGGGVVGIEGVAGGICKGDGVFKF